MARLEAALTIVALWRADGRAVARVWRPAVADQKGGPIVIRVGVAFEDNAPNRAQIVLWLGMPKGTVTTRASASVIPAPVELGRQGNAKVTVIVGLVGHDGK